MSSSRFGVGIHLTDAHVQSCRGSARGSLSFGQCVLPSRDVPTSASVRLDRWAHYTYFDILAAIVDIHHSSRSDSTLIGRVRGVLIRTLMNQMVLLLRFIVARVSTARLQVVVDGDGIYRLGHSVLWKLSEFHQETGAGIIAATADPTGDYVVWCRMNVRDSLRG